MGGGAIAIDGPKNSVIKQRRHSVPQWRQALAVQSNSPRLFEKLFHSIAKEKSWSSNRKRKQKSGSYLLRDSLCQSWARYFYRKNNRQISSCQQCDGGKVSVRSWSGKRTSRKAIRDQKRVTKRMKGKRDVTYISSRHQRSIFSSFNVTLTRTTLNYIRNLYVWNEYYDMNSAIRKRFSKRNILFLVV